MKHHSSRINSLSNNYIFFTNFHISQAILNSYIVTHKNNKKGHKMCRGSFILTHKTKPKSPYVIAAECKKKLRRESGLISDHFTYLFLAHTKIDID